MGINIAIDGPAGAGKSTISDLVANRLGFIHVDTGALYRGLAYNILDKKIDIENPAKLKQILDESDIDIEFVNNEQRIILNDKDITQYLREEKVGDMASKSSAKPEVRAKLLDIQRRLAKEHNVVMDGRDIGSVVLTNADYKIFLTASVEERAKRRYTELTNKGIKCDLEEIQREIKSRDERDTNRDISPLIKARDAILVDTTDYNIEEVVDIICKKIQK